VSVPSGPRTWPLRFGLGFTLALLVVPALSIALTRHVGIEAGQHPLEVANRIEAQLEKLRESRDTPDVFRVAYLGDSTVFAYAAGHDLPRALQHEIDRRQPGTPRISIHNLAYPAMGTIAYYFMADRIAEAEPDLIVWETSFTHVSPRWRSNTRKGLSGFVAPGRIPEALGLPLSHVALTADQLLFYRAVLTLGGLDAWQALGQEQSKVEKLKPVLENALFEWVGRRPEARFRIRGGLNVSKSIMLEGRKPRRYTAEAEQGHYGDALGGLEPDHPALRALDLGLGRFGRAEIPTLVYLNPINVEHLREIGVLDPVEIARSAALYREIAEGRGAEFLDLHDYLPDRYFLDAPGHFFSTEELNGPAMMADALSPSVLRSAGVADSSVR
jgi:hypothetical protein